MKYKFLGTRRRRPTRRVQIFISGMHSKKLFLLGGYTSNVIEYTKAEKFQKKKKFFCINYTVSNIKEQANCVVSSEREKR